MSATIDVGFFANYFSRPLRNVIVHAANNNTDKQLLSHHLTTGNETEHLLLDLPLIYSDSDSSSKWMSENNHSKEQFNRRSSHQPKRHHDGHQNYAWEISEREKGPNPWRHDVTVMDRELSMDGNGQSRQGAYWNKGDERKNRQSVKSDENRGEDDLEFNSPRERNLDREREWEFQTPNRKVNKITSFYCLRRCVE